jgi:hypothetical protein
MTSSKTRAAVTGVLVGVHLQPEIAKRIDDWRRQQDIPGRPEAIRRLIEIGQKAKSAK